jgi:hypothetical protein
MSWRSTREPDSFLPSFAILIALHFPTCAFPCLGIGFHLSRGMLSLGRSPKGSVVTRPTSERQCFSHSNVAVGSQLGQLCHSDSLTSKLRIVRSVSRNGRPKKYPHSWRSFRNQKFAIWWFRPRLFPLGRSDTNQPFGELSRQSPR